MTFLFLLFSTQAFAIANFSGHWIANSGQLSSNVGLSAKCTKVEVEIVQTEQVIETKIYDATCGLFGSKWGPIKQDIKDGKIFEAGIEVGTIDDDTLITVSTSGTYQYAYNLKLIKAADGSTQLMSYYGTRGSLGAMVTEATHSQVKNSASH